MIIKKVVINLTISLATTYLFSIILESIYGLSQFKPLIIFSSICNRGCPNYYVVGNFISSIAMVLISIITYYFIYFKKDKNIKQLSYLLIVITSFFVLTAVLPFINRIQPTPGSWNNL